MFGVPGTFCSAKGDGFNAFELNAYDGGAELGRPECDVPSHSAMSTLCGAVPTSVAAMMCKKSVYNQSPHHLAGRERPQ